MLRNYQAARELERVRNLSAFNVQGATRWERVNQHATRYAFADGSIMQIRTTAGRGDAWHPEWTGCQSDVQLGPVQGVPIAVNATGRAAA